ncbi:2,3-bisphosphoglycerate-independent phosphoglycerate mutase [Wenzhouxiangella marina]|uniref:2,3-bisphosphoglycerate-independent phosphoglycerate mutase n=1 Tax=Wenzhouxiangella marina TaxID=1579979 RepID=A0A0K0XWC1_9GAMM|nr:2,3-bisphosphoglycerate-independent phosphoglycerate mutase [Wenzhouxiangella marina]AKS41970.1 phosphoglyceromutase [Wenzhouxiangella marina]MBB6086263.1 2,3-bisphosphoglycerate-independent phosphoglycerate mutase [Wenzhouxiangella marina]
MPQHRPLTLLILDGWGHREAAPDNAITTADTPNWDALWASQPHALLRTSGLAVGLPEGQMGNSEVGHMNIGAGRIVYQELTRIDRAIDSGEFETNPVLQETLDAAARSGGCVHILGLLSPGGVHSHERHLLATLDAALANPDIRSVAVHAFLDGRDMPPRSAEPSIEQLELAVERDPRAAIASVSGRYYAMDRDQRWDRVERAWNAVVEARGTQDLPSASEALRRAYEAGQDDEFVEPVTIAGGHAIDDGDVVLFINFRADRARQLTQALIDPDFAGFERRRPELAAMATMTRYQADFPCPALFEPERMKDLFGEVLARSGLKQLRIAETEKYAHVTYFFNGGEETVFEGEDRVLVPSPKVATYDLQPEMSAPELSERLCAAIAGGDYDVIISNVANPDMVGHSGRFEAAVAAVEAVDRLLGQVLDAIRNAGGELLITADHGNVEQMTDPDTGQAHTAHTLNPVPFVYVGPRDCRMEAEGSLRDIAPTMLALLGLERPERMTGRPLAHCDEAEALT